MRISDWSSDVCSSDLPIGHVAHAAREDAAHRFVAADADGAQRAVAVGDHGHAAVVGLDERGRAGAGRGDERLAAQVLLGVAAPLAADAGNRSEEHTSELQSLMRISYAGFCLKKKTKKRI